MSDDPSPVPVGFTEILPGADHTSVCTLSECLPEFKYCSVEERALLTALWPKDMTRGEAAFWYLKTAEPACIQFHEKGIIVTDAAAEALKAAMSHHDAEEKIARNRYSKTIQQKWAHEARLKQLSPNKKASPEQLVQDKKARLVEE